MKKLAFTMAEILLSLTIIGVVAAITLPSLMGNINERTWNTQRKALHARISQAIGMMPQLNGFGTYKQAVYEESDVYNEIMGAYEMIKVSDAVDTVSEAFVTEGLSKVLKINNICDHEHLADCGIASTVYGQTGNTVWSEIPTTANAFMSYWGNVKNAAFETQNGESVLLLYNPFCTVEPTSYTPRKGAEQVVCASFIYDLNGNKGPNTAGKDVGFISVLYPTDSVVVAPILVAGSVNSSNLSGTQTECKAFDPDSRAITSHEAAAVAMNLPLAGFSMYDGDAGTEIYMHAKLVSSHEYDYLVEQSAGLEIKTVLKSDNTKYPCVKR